MHIYTCCGTQSVLNNVHANDLSEYPGATIQVRNLLCNCFKSRCADMKQQTKEATELFESVTLDLMRPYPHL
ncbi:hypothetical protein PR048_004574 [Dryococelus australis]|uniref:Uncharacterized protein n=1 Tax=Dryococelus australis TaxID=614101 RepID=A0ABQ9I5S2_9NEOP|nr:hypothetical protein PR048_004574 [Dryococelus australis]